MAASPDPYAVLGVPRDASDDEIARARRRLSRELHPDVNPAPDAAARFNEIQQAYERLSAARPQRAPAPKASPEILLQPAFVDFGRLTPQRPRADAKVTLAWAGPPPGRLESTPGGTWWASLGTEQPATSSVVFYLRAHAYAGTRSGRQRAQFTVIFDDTTLTAQLTAEIQGEFPPDSRPDFTPRRQPGAEGRLSVVSAELKAWLVVIVALIVLLLVIGIR